MTEKYGCIDIKLAIVCNPTCGKLQTQSWWKPGTPSLITKPNRPLKEDERHSSMDTPQIITAFQDEYRWLSNFWPSPISVQMYGVDRNFATGEHYYQAAKAYAMSTIGDLYYDHIDDYINTIESAPSAGKAKRLGQKAEIDVAKWERIAFHYMLEVQKQKYSQNFHLALNLINTGNAEFIEGNTWGDRIWGTVDGEGLNLLGLALSMTRDKLRNGEFNVAFRQDVQD